MGNLLFSPKGRIAAKPYWIGLAIIIVVSIATSFLAKALGPAGGSLSLLINLVVIYVSVCVMGKRRHDFGKSAWGVVFLYIFTIVISIVALFMFGGTEYFQAVMADPEAAQDPVAAEAMMKEHVQIVPWMVVTYLPFLIFAVLWGLKPGDTGDNKYGPPPA